MMMDNNLHTLRHISSADFAAIGVNEIAYVRKVESDQGQLFGIFAADGTQLAMAASLDLAVAAIRQNDMEPMSLH
ncbi:MAG TPA: DUF1150 family protein [Kiloniellales bacterium]|nr:DUF1150 family protein [Kiloniellales bacterium]